MIVFDASSLFNLHSGALFPIILSLPYGPIRLGPQVRRECRTIASTLEELQSEGKAVFLSDDDLSYGRYLDLSERYELGPGETECMVIAESNGFKVCSDDRKARRMIAAELGRDRLTGTLGLLKQAIEAKAIGLEQARSAYANMIARGAFLPAFNFDSPKPLPTTHDPMV